MTEQQYQVRLESGHIGTLKCRLKARELIGRNVMIRFEGDGVEYCVTGIVCHVYQQLELGV